MISAYSGCCLFRALSAAFAQLATAFPAQTDMEVTVATVDVNGLPPATLSDWYYEGSLTTPPCTEKVDWMLAMQSLDVAEADIAKFAALYPTALSFSVRAAGLPEISFRSTSAAARSAVDRLWGQRPRQMP
jgi:hypothetical protein